MGRVYEVDIGKDETFEHDFKVGDIVYIDNYHFTKWIESNRMGRIESIHFDEKWCGNYGVSFSVGGEPTRCIVGLRRAGVYPTRLAKKLYPEWEEVNGWLYPTLKEY